MIFIRRLITFAIVIIIFYFLLSSLIKNWSSIPFENIHFSLIHLFVSFIFLLINYIVFVEAWRTIIIKIGGLIDFKNAFWVMSASQTAKYIPGGIWFALGRMHLGRTEELKAETIGISVIIETGLTFLVGILICVLSIYAGGLREKVNFVFMIPILIFFVVILYPPILNTLINTGLKIIRKPEINLNISYCQILQISVYFFGLWIAQIIGFYFLINAIYPVSLSKIFHISAAYTISWMSGFIVIFAPGGLGVREGMMSLLLSSFLPSPLAIAISFLSRVWITVFEIVVFFVGFAIHRFRSKK